MKLIIFLILPALFISCDNVTDSGDDTSSEVMLAYEFTHGWTGQVYSMIVFENKSGYKYIEDNVIEFEFSNDEKRRLGSLLEYFPDFNNLYRPEEGAWMDIPTHLLIHYPESLADSVVILEPINSNNIPVELRELVNILLEKLF